MDRTINLTNEQEAVALRLCDNGIGVEPIPGEVTVNLTVLELMQWRIDTYLEGKRKKHLYDDRKTITREEVDAIKAARPTL